jgi:putative ABC transport system ATP-binding protein
MWKVAEPIPEVRSVCKIYQMGEVQVNALQEVDPELYAGEFLVLLVPSGSGILRPACVRTSL